VTTPAHQRAIAGLVSYYIQDVDPGGSDPTGATARAVVAAFGELPWFYSLPLRLYLASLEYASVFFRGSLLSRLSSNDRKSYVERVCSRLPMMGSLARLLRLWTYLAWYDSVAR